MRAVVCDSRPRAECGQAPEDNLDVRLEWIEADLRALAETLSGLANRLRQSEATGRAIAAALLRIKARGGGGLSAASARALTRTAPAS